MREYDLEPIPGLPEHLPFGETILWQGAPNWKTLARRAFHIRGVGLYFAVLLVWGIISGVADHSAATEIALGFARSIGLAMVALGLIALFSWAVARTTLYTITSRRIVFRIGIAFPMTVNLPFKAIETAGARLYPNGDGDIVVTMVPEQRLALLVVWPHARPWRISRPEPMLRGIADAAAVSALLAPAIAAEIEGGSVRQAVVAAPASLTSDQPHAAGAAA